MPVGIDTNIFQREREVSRLPNSVLAFGRISRIKNPEVFIKACRLAKERGIQFKASVVGDPRPEEGDYYKELQRSVAAGGLGGLVTFESGIPNMDAPRLYSRYEIYVNLTPTGSFDKTILEAMACEMLPLACNKSLAQLVDERFLFREGDATDLMEKLMRLLALPEEEKFTLGQAFRLKVKETHDLSLLIKLIREEAFLLT